jgi:hypothetical protein
MWTDRQITDRRTDMTNISRFFSAILWTRVRIDIGVLCKLCRSSWAVSGCFWRVLTGVIVRHLLLKWRLGNLALYMLTDGRTDGQADGLRSLKAASRNSFPNTTITFIFLSLVSERASSETTWDVFPFNYLLTYLHTYLLHAAESFLRTVRLSASQEIPRILWNPKVHCRIHKNPPSFSVLCQINPIHASHNSLPEDPYVFLFPDQNFIVPAGTLRLPWLRNFRDFSSVVRQMPG